MSCNKNMSLDEIKAYLHDKKAFISDMDGVIYHGNVLLPGVAEFVEWLKKITRNICF